MWLNLWLHQPAWETWSIQTESTVGKDYTVRLGLTVIAARRSSLKPQLCSPLLQWDALATIWSTWGTAGDELLTLIWSSYQLYRKYFIFLLQSRIYGFILLWNDFTEYRISNTVCVFASFLSKCVCSFNLNPEINWLYTQLSDHWSWSHLKINIKNIKGPIPYMFLYFYFCPLLRHLLLVIIQPQPLFYCVRLMCVNLDCCLAF